MIIPTMLRHVGIELLNFLSVIRNMDHRSMSGQLDAFLLNYLQVHRYGLAGVTWISYTSSRKLWA